MEIGSTIERPPQVDRSDWRFLSIDIGALKAFTKKESGDATDRYFISGTASSSVEDLYGDTLTEKCQASMLAQASNHLTMWLNHDYDVPEDIAGACAEAQLKNSTADDGTSCLDLDIVMEVDPENPRALKAWQHVNRGIRLGFSIGGFFLDYELVFEDENDWWGHFIVDDILLLEISLVGIPANPRAYTKTFEKARAAVVAHAEQIAKDAFDASLTQKRILVQKSFGLNPEQKGHRRMKCGHKDGCDKPKAEDSLLCVEHRDAAKVVPIRKGTGNESGCTGCAMSTLETPDPEIVEGVHVEGCDKYVAPVAVKSLDDPTQQSQVVEAMKCIQRCVNSPGHQMCAEPETHARTAHTILKSMLPSDYNTPEDAELSTAPPAVVLELTPERIEEFKALWQTELAKSGETIIITKEPDALKTAQEKLSADIETLTKQKSDLEQQIATLKATPGGRVTRDTRKNPGSSNGSETSVPAAAYYK